MGSLSKASIPHPIFLHHPPWNFGKTAFVGNSQRDFGQSLPNLNGVEGVPRGCNPGGGNIIGYHNIARDDHFDVPKCSQNLLYLGISYKFRDSEPVTAGVI